MSWFDLFFEDKKELLSEIEIFEKRRNLDLIRKLQKEKNKTDFLSFITEIRFGLTLDPFCDKMKHNCRLPGFTLTPDWLVEMNGQEIMLEVARINATQDDQKFIDFDTMLMEAIEKIEKPYSFKLHYDVEDFDQSQIDFSDFKEFLENWLTKERSIGDIAIYQNVITVECMRRNENLTHAGVMGEFRAIKHKPYRVFSKKGRFMSKVERYAGIVESLNMPYIVCLYLHFESWLELDDVSSALYGNEAEFVGDIEFGGMFPNSIFQDISKALYYNNNLVKKTVSGVLVKRNDSNSYLHNYNYQNRLTELNKLTLLTSFSS